MTKVSLDIAGWRVRAVGDLAAVPASMRGLDVAARVPGCVHTDLIRAGLIPDPLVGQNEDEVRWIGECDWEYRACFVAHPELLAQDRIDLVCEGLDTIAAARVNGELIGRAANMFHPHRFEMRSVVRAGENEVSITFRSPLKYIRAEEERLGKRPVNGDWDPYIFIRKTACNFGWDWGPKLATCGIWKPAYVQAWTGVRVARGHAKTTRVSGEDWEVRVTLDLEWSARAVAGLSLEVELSGHACSPAQASRELKHGESSVSLTLPVRSPRLWWPRGQPEHAQSEIGFVSAQVALHGEPQGVANDWQTPLGFREVRLITGPDRFGSRFALEINGREVFCKGANWIPEVLLIGECADKPANEDDPTDSVYTRLKARLKQVADANMNMVRVWGGGLYEDDRFYELCDDLGIMVWQDFMFACAMYPEEAPYPALIEAEARHQVARLSPHPAVVLWCGGNECTWAHDAWGNAPGERPWKERLAGKTWGSAYYHQLLPRLVNELAPATPYWPNSPWQGSQSLTPNNAEHGDRHTWDRRGDGYRDIVPRFCSEFGHQSPCNYATLAGAIGEAGLRLGSDALDHRQRATGGTKRHIDEALEETFRKPLDFDEWHFLAQLTQARAMKAGIEWLRANQPRCMGALIWQLNDCCAGMSWSLVDSDGREKLAYHAAKDAFRNRLLTIQPLSGRPWLHAVNDLGAPATYVVEARRMSFDGGVLAHIDNIAAACPPRSSSAILDLAAALGEPRDPRREFIIAQAPGHRATWFYLPDRELVYPEPRCSVVAPKGNRWVQAIPLRAEALVRDLTLVRDRAPGPVLRGPMLTTLLPGETCYIEVRLGLPDEDNPDQPPPEFDPQTLVRRPALWCANWFGAH